MEQASSLEGTQSAPPELTVDPPSGTALVEIGHEINADKRIIHRAFHYAELQDDVANNVRRSVAQIRRMEVDAVQALFAVGRELQSVKDVLPYGRFGPWLRLEFNWTERTAQRYMLAAQVLGGKSDTVSVLGPSAIHALAAPSTPEPVRAEVLARIEAGEHLTSGAVIKQVRMARRSTAAQPVAWAAPESQIFEQKPNEALVDQPCVQGRPEPRDEQRDYTPAQLAAELILQHVVDVRGELARFLEEADPEELRVNLLQGCSISAA